MSPDKEAPKPSPQPKTVPARESPGKKDFTFPRKIEPPQPWPKPKQ